MTCRKEIDLTLKRIEESQKLLGVPRVYMEDAGSAPPEPPTCANTVIITQAEYYALLDDSAFLKALEDNGVEDWWGHDKATEDYKKVAKDSVWSVQMEIPVLMPSDRERGTTSAWEEFKKLYGKELGWTSSVTLSEEENDG